MTVKELTDDMCEKDFVVHWILNNKRVLLPRNYLGTIPNVDDEIRVDRRTVFKVTKRVWCFDESIKQRVNIGLVRVKL